MIQQLSKKTVLLFLAGIFSTVAFVFSSCQKEISSEGFIPAEASPDLTTKIASSVSGFVTDENDAAAQGATVSVSGINTTTDKYGFFEVKNVQVVKNAAVVTVIKPGYFNGIKTYIATAGKAAFFRIKLMPKTSIGNIDAVAGGIIAQPDGFSVKLPANGVVVASSGAAYTGQVNVAARWLNPAAADINRIMPGDLRGLDNNGYLKLLATYGMCAVELTGTSGELLQVATGKKASVTFPLRNTGLQSTAPASIPLWYFDEAVGLWKEQGNAVLDGDKYSGEVSHFSYWNCDIPLDNSVTFDLTVKGVNGKPIPSAIILVKYAGGTYTGAHGLTDSGGYVKGRIPANAQLIVEVITDYSCNGPAYTQTVTTTTADLQLGTITVGSNNSATITGSVTDCSNAPVTNGYVVVQYGYYNYRANVGADGTFSIDMLICWGSNVSVNIIAVDMASQQQSTPLTQAITSGSNAVGTLNACGTAIQEFINYTINGTNSSYSAPAYSFTQAVSFNTEYIGAGLVFPQESNLRIAFSETGIGVGSSQNLESFYAQGFTDSTQILTPITVNITEYGTVGQFIAGNFSGTLTGGAPANTPYVITCSFRVKRKN